MFRFLTKTLLLAMAWFVFSAANGSTALAQCEGIYSKTVTRKILDQKVILITESDGYFKDLTGDGKPDVVGFVGNDVNSPVSKIYILPTDGASGFGTPIQITPPAPVFPRPEYLKLADFDSDGKIDFAVQTYESQKRVIVYRNNGGGSFTPLAPTLLANNEEIKALLDINNDGLADLIQSQGNSMGNGRFRPANADGSFGASSPFGATAEFGYTYYDFPADFNADGKTDFPVVGWASTGGYYLRTYDNAGNGTFAMSSTSTPLPYASVELAGIADVNGDGKSDLLFRQQQYQASLPLKLSLLTNSGNGNFTNTELSLPPGTTFLYPSFRDMNGDGSTDIIASLYIGQFGDAYSIFTNNGAGSFTRRDYFNAIPGNPMGDLDGDGKTDFLKINSNVNSGYPLIFFNITQLSVRKNVCNRSGQTKIVDFNGDGLADTVFWRESDGRWRVNFRNNSSPTTFQWGQAGDVPTPGDFDGDGKTDYAVFRPSTGAWYYVNSSNGSFYGIQFGTNEDKPVAADYNGDGRTDIAVWRPSSGIWYVMFSGTNQFYGAQFGASEDKPVPADYDGDGKIDFAVFRPSSGYWYVSKTSDGTFFAVNWGLNTDTLVPADYDGDGKTDIAVMRPGGNNVWYIRRASDGLSFGFQFALNGDTVQVSDWNGDEIWDFGVFRSTTGYWYSSFSFDGFSTFGQTAGEVPVSSLNRNY